MTEKGKERHNIGPFSAQERLTRIDGRTRAGKAITEAQRVLVEAVGGNPTTAQMVLIQASAVLWARISMMGEKVVHGGDTSGEYVIWQNTLRKNLMALGLTDRAKKDTARVGTLADDEQEADYLRAVLDKLHSLTAEQAAEIDALHAAGQDVKAMALDALHSGLSHEDWLFLMGLDMEQISAYSPRADEKNVGTDWTP